MNARLNNHSQHHASHLADGGLTCCLCTQNSYHGDVAHDRGFPQNNCVRMCPFKLEVAQTGAWQNIKMPRLSNIHIAPKTSHPFTTAVVLTTTGCEYASLSPTFDRTPRQRARSQSWTSCVNPGNRPRTRIATESLGLKIPAFACFGATDVYGQQDRRDRCLCDVEHCFYIYYSAFTHFG